MPRYNYYCQICDEYFELQHSMTEKVEECVECTSSSFSRVPSIPAYIQKQKRIAKHGVKYAIKDTSSVATR